MNKPKHTDWRYRIKSPFPSIEEVGGRIYVGKYYLRPEKVVYKVTAVRTFGIQVKNKTSDNLFFEWYEIEDWIEVPPLKGILEVGE